MTHFISQRLPGNCISQKTSYEKGAWVLSMYSDSFCFFSFPSRTMITWRRKWRGGRFSWPRLSWRPKVLTPMAPLHCQHWVASPLLPSPAPQMWSRWKRSLRTPRPSNQLRRSQTTGHKPTRVRTMGKKRVHCKGWLLLPVNIQYSS